MRRRRRPLAAVAVIATVALMSGCGSSAPATGSSGSNGGDPAASRYEKAVKFADCIRAHGDSGFADPTASGEFVGGIAVSPAVWQKAVDACKGLQPPGTLSGQRTPKQQSNALKFAQCIRENGVTDFPDPVNGQPLVDTTKIPSASEPGGKSILHAAMQKCRDALAAVIGGQ
jgi:hypothetical protein